MKKVLVVAKSFADANDTGSIRMFGMAKYLQKFNWDPIVLTSQPGPSQGSPFRIVGTQDAEVTSKWKALLGLDPKESLKEQLDANSPTDRRGLIDFLLRMWEEVFAYPDSSIGWHQIAVDAAEELIRGERIDAIISSSGPVTSHIIAKTLSERHGIPWLADFRDLWTQNHYYKYGPARRLVERRFEVSTISSADALSTVSTELARKLGSLHVGKTVFCIHNGYDADLENKGTPLTGNFSITFTGRLYRENHDPEPLFRALRNLGVHEKIDLADVSVAFYGQNEGWLDEIAARNGVSETVRNYGFVPRSVAIDMQRKSQLLLFISWNDPRQRGLYSAKIFDYLAAKRPILSIGMKGTGVDEILAATEAGVHCSEQEEIEHWISRFYQEFKTNGFVSYRGNISAVRRFSHVEMASKFAQALDVISSP